MRVVVVGGTGFIGRRIVDDLTQHGHQAVVVHRGITEVEPQAGTTHIHASRDEAMPISLERLGPRDVRGPNARTLSEHAPDRWRDWSQQRMIETKESSTGRLGEVKQVRD